MYKQLKNEKFGGKKESIYKINIKIERVLFI
jgi:hypothetical protein